MAWLIWLGISLVLSFFLAGRKGWLRFWPVGLVALAVVYILDSTLIRLGAFAYHYGLPELGGLPLLYFLSTIPNGVTVARFYPSRHWLRLPYVLVLAAVLLLVEWLMSITGNFRHLRWSPGQSLGLNVVGLVLVFWLGEWLGVLNEDGR
ncbi:hypothetical protein GFC01_05515 [Desulfofundulus thermobenzoicus]|uniref:Uncharacterized protein n=1 Tax=Desulfofundulus thermobenzoicus TaxID=29376 RepID=A0A6N7IQ88_9FIRM|nr:hypothetical protein [Desulfofundulus thermobenzoicus]MQL51727.1 hypothetical protein [Desulfofundulus thermobenzoicus]HHW42776.1 hypothetical protein [Desulfotomaculum sp.]